MAVIDIHQRDDLAFPQSLPEFQRLFPDDAACAAYLGRARWPDGFVCPHCGQIADPFRIVTRPGVLECRACRRQAGLLVGTVMERSHTPLSVWFWAAYLVASQTPGMSAVQFQRQLGLTRYETAFGILHKLRAGMVRPDQDRIGGRPKEHVEVDETWVGGRTRGEGRGIHHKTLVAAAVEVRHRKPGTAQDKRKDGRYAGRVRLAIAADRSADSLCGFVENAVMPGSLIVTDDWNGYASLRKRGYDHHAIAESGDPEIAEQFMPMIHLVFSNLKTWLNGIHHGVSAKHLQAYLNEFTFRFNRRFYPFNAFRSLLGIAGGVDAPTYPKTARRALGAVATIFDYAKASDMRAGDNPASWDVFRFLWPPPPATRHMRSMPPRDLPAFYRRLIEKDSTTALGLAFLILTAARTAEAVGGRWSEIDFDARLCVIPAERMKARREHRAVLSDAAMAILMRLRDRHPNSDYLFPAAHGGRLGYRTLEGFLHRAMGETTVSVHGFRASFSTHMHEMEGFAHEDIELCIAHQTGNAVSRSYNRATAVEKRRVIMQAWADHVNGTPAENKILHLRPQAGGSRHP